MRRHPVPQGHEGRLWHIDSDCTNAEALRNGHLPAGDVALTSGIAIHNLNIIDSNSHSFT